MCMHTRRGLLTCLELTIGGLANSAVADQVLWVLQRKLSYYEWNGRILRHYLYLLFGLGKMGILGGCDIFKILCKWVLFLYYLERHLSDYVYLIINKLVLTIIVHL